MKTLTFSCLLVVTTTVTLFAQAAAVANKTAQADRKFLQDLELTDPRSPAPVPAGDTPANPVPDMPANTSRNGAPVAPAAVPHPPPAEVARQLPPNRAREVAVDRKRESAAPAPVVREKVQADEKPVVRRQRGETHNTRTADAARTEVYEQDADRGVNGAPVIRRSSRTGAGGTVDVETTPSGRVEITPRVPAVRKRTYVAPAKVEERPAKSVTVTRTVNVVPEEDDDHADRHDEHGFFHRLFHHERVRKEVPVTTTTTVEQTTLPSSGENR